MTDDIKFYNYHEYEIVSTQNRRNKRVLLTDFPNSYVEEDSIAFRKTRLIRIPRAYHKICSDSAVFVNSKFDKSAAIPRFSEYFPGTEPGAMESIENDHLGSHILSSKSNLRHFLNEQEYFELISNINRLVYQVFNPWRPYNIFYNICGMLTGWLSEFILRRPDSTALEELSYFIEQTNLKYSAKGIRVMNPFECGFLSVSD